MVSLGRQRRLSRDIPLLVQRVGYQQGRILLTSGTEYEIGLDASVDGRGGRAGFAAVIDWPGMGHLLVFAQAWNGGPLSVGYSEGLALLLLLSWLQMTCAASGREAVRLRIFTDRRDMVDGLDRGIGEGRWSRHLHNRIYRTIRELLMERRMEVELQWRARSTHIIHSADSYANEARLAAPSTGTTLSASVVPHLSRASDIYRRRPSRARWSPNRDNGLGRVD